MNPAMEKIPTPPVHITERALREIRHIISTKNIPGGYGLRIGVKGGGCAGQSYMLGFDEKTDADDVYMLEEITILIDKKHMMYLINKSIKYYEGELAMGFVFSDANTQG